MVGLIVAIILVSPPSRSERPPLLKCITSCKHYEKWQKCWYDERISCGRLEVCVDTTRRECVPWVVNLGEWSPVPKDYTPAQYDPLIYPRNTTESTSQEPEEENTGSTFGYPRGTVNGQPP